MSVQQHILIVEDEANQRLMLERALASSSQWSVATAGSGHEALEAIRTSIPDLIITDYNMNTMSGLELIAELRARGITSRIILMTAYSSPELKHAAEYFAVDSYVTKPISITMLRCLASQVMSMV